MNRYDPSILEAAGSGVGALPMEGFELTELEARDEFFAPIPGVVWQYDPVARRFTYVSRRAEPLLGYPREAWLEEPGFWEARLHDSDRERAVRECASAVVEGRDHTLRYRLVHQSGRPIPIQDLACVVRRPGATPHLRGVMREVAAPEEAEGPALDQVLDALDEPVVLHREGTILYANAAAARWLQGCAARPLVGSALLTLVPRELAEVLAQDFRALASGKPAPVREAALGRGLRAEPRYAQLTTARWPGREGTLLTVARESTELREQRRRVLVADRFIGLGTRTAAVLHELGRPLAALRGALERAERSPELAEAAFQAQRLQALVDDLSAVLRDERAGGGSSSLSSLVVDALRLAQQELAPVGQVKVAGPEHAQVAGSAPRLLQALVNLLVNAAQALARQKDGPAGRVELTWRAAGTDGWLLEVTDNGPGIPQPLLKRIFEPFFTTRELGTQLGLGLSIAREAVEEAGGRLEVESRPGRTTFQVTLRSAGTARAPRVSPWSGAKGGPLPSG